MNSEPSVPKCPQCGAAIPADAPQGLCPRCVLLGAATSTDAGKPAQRTEPPAPEALRAAFPQLEIVELIGRGGMGFVYKARQAKLDRLVALKLLPVELGADPHFAERFNREARALARLNHPGIVAVYDFGVSGGFCYLLMEFVDGVNLRQAMQAGRFSQREALTIVPKICEAIQFAHEQGVLHRDIKPENILLDGAGRVKIADFGIAKLVGEDPPDLTLTLSGARLGTPTYMAPEQIEHPGTVDHRADIYSLGVVFYELLTGELPLGRFAPPSAKADLDTRVDAIVMRALAKERELRQQSAGEVKTEVETVAREARPQKVPAAPVKDWNRPAEGEYRSPMTFWGWPLLHIAFGRDPATGKMRTARGVFAIGNHAVGGLAIGGTAYGVIAFGGMAVGGIALGGLGLGLFAFAGIALGLVSIGGISIGLLLALGGGALGFQAGGGLAVGRVAAGGLAIGHHVWDGRVQDEGAHWLIDVVRSGGLQAILLIFGGLASVVPAVAMTWAARLLRHGSEPTDPGGAPTPPGPPVPPSAGVRSWFGRWLRVIAGVVGALLVFVAAKTVNDLAMGRSRVQPVELVVFLVVTGAALLCWRLGRRLHGNSVTAVAVEPLPARPFLFAGVAPEWKPWLLLGLGLAGALLCVQSVAVLLPMGGALAGVVRSGPLPFLLMVLAASALIAGAWHGSLRQRELLHSLCLHVPAAGPAMDCWLSRAALLVLAGLGGGMLIGGGSLFMVLAGQLNSNPGSNGLLLAAVVVITGLAVTWNRRDARRPALTPAPTWMRRAAWWFLAAGAVALLPTLVRWNSSSFVWHSASLLLFTGLALLSANPGLRRLALGVNWFGLFSGLGGSLALLWLGSRHELPQDISIGVPGVTTRPGMVLLIGLLEAGAFAAGLLALHRSDARAAFGVAPTSGGRRWLGRLAVAAFMVVMAGLQLVIAKQAARATGPQADVVARLREIPAGGDRAWLTLDPPADLPLRFTVNIWSNSVARPVATNEQTFGTYSRPVQVQLTRAIRPGADGTHWEVSDHSELDAEGEETWLPSGIPLSVALQAVNTGATVQLSAGDRLRRWLFLPPFEASRFIATGSLPQQPEWGVSVDLEGASPDAGISSKGAEASRGADASPAKPVVVRVESPLLQDTPVLASFIACKDGLVVTLDSRDFWLRRTATPGYALVTSSLRPSSDGRLWEVSGRTSDNRLGQDFWFNRRPSADGINRGVVGTPTGIELDDVWFSPGIPTDVPLTTVNSDKPVQLSPGNRIRHWLFLPAEAATKLAAGEPAPMHQKWGIAVDFEVPSDAVDPEVAERLIGLQQERQAEVHQRFKQGAATSLEVAAVDRDVAVAIAIYSRDAVAVAQANRTYATLALEAARKQFEAGTLSTLELHGYEATNQIAALELAAALQATGKPAPADVSNPTNSSFQGRLNSILQAVGTNQTSTTFQARLAAIRLDLAQQSLAERRKQAEVGLVAPRGQEVLAAELAVVVAEAELKGDPLAAAKARLNHAEQVLAIVQRRFDAGRATPEELSAAKLAVAETTAGVAKLEPHP